jgi:signal recognition particle GTPase
MSEGTSWTERVFGGLRKTSERLGENLSGIVSKTRLDDAQLDELEDALILSDLGPRVAARIRERLAEERFERGADEQAIKEAVAEEIAKILRPVAKPIDIVAFPRPQVILVIGVNGSGKTTTIAKLAHYFQELDYGVMLAAGDTFRAAAIGQLKVWAERVGVERPGAFYDFPELPGTLREVEGLRRQVRDLRVEVVRRPLRAEAAAVYWAPDGSCAAVVLRLGRMGGAEVPVALMVASVDAPTFVPAPAVIA